MVNEIRKICSLLLISSVFFLTSCESTTTIHAPIVINDPVFNNRTELSRFETKINSALNFIANGQLELAQKSVSKINANPKNRIETALLIYTQAKLMLAMNNIDNAYILLNDNKSLEPLKTYPAELQIYLGTLNSEILALKGLNLDSIKLRLYISHIINNGSPLHLQNNEAIWQTLNKTTLDEIENARKYQDDTALDSWLSINQIIRNNVLSLDEKNRLIDTWLTTHSGHAAITLAGLEITAIKEQAKNQSRKIAVILPFHGKYAAISEAIRDGIMYANYKSKSHTVFHFYNADVSMLFKPVYQQAITDGADLIIGPLLKTQLEELYTFDNISVRTIALNKITSPSKKNLFQFSIGSEDEIESLIELANLQNLENAFVLSQNEEFSQKNSKLFITSWKKTNNNLILNHNFSQTTDMDIELDKPLNLIKSKDRINNLNQLLGVQVESDVKSRTDIDIIVLFTKTEAAREISSILNLHFYNKLPKYSNSSIYRGFPDQSNDKELDNIIFTDMPIVINHETQIKNTYSRSPLFRLFAFGMDTYEICNNFNNMLSSEDFVLNGSTGKISLNNGAIFRKPEYGIFSNGLVKNYQIVNIEQ